LRSTYPADIFTVNPLHAVSATILFSTRPYATSPTGSDEAAVTSHLLLARPQAGVVRGGHGIVPG